jgi:hypothetical protein
MSPVASLVAVHQELDRVFARFRELLLVGDGVRAAAVLKAYGAMTADHAGAEETLLVPLLDDAARWPAELYTGQHAKLLAAIDRAVDAVVGVVAGTAGWRARALAALDVATPLMHLAEHHHLAEEQDLLPLVGEREPARLVEVAARFWTIHATFRAALADADAALARHG